MNLWNLFQRKSAVQAPLVEEMAVRNDDLPNALDLGWYYSEEDNEFQMAKIDGDDRATHTYVIGASGSGKTKFLEFLVQQDIEKRHGFGVIDPHGDLVEDIKGFLACLYDKDDLAERVVLIDPTDPEFTVTFNPLERLPGVSVSDQASALISAFKKIWSDSWGVRMEDLLRSSLLALGEKDLTLTDLPAFLTRREFRKNVLRTVTHPVAQDYFRRFDTMTDRSQVSWVEPILNKVNAFFADERIRQMFASPKSSFHFRKVMDEGHVLLCKLDKGKLHDSADLLGSLLLVNLQLAAFSRSDLPLNKRTPFYLYIDEFQNFAAESFGVILSEARKYGLSLIMAHQTLAQIPEELRSIILGNVGIQVSFRLNRKDAQLLAKESYSYSGYSVKAVSRMKPVFWSLGEEWEQYTEELQNLPPRVCIIKHKIEGGLIAVQTADIAQAKTVLGLSEEDYTGYLANLPIGRGSVVARTAVAREIEARQQRAAASTESRPQGRPAQEDGAPDEGEPRETVFQTHETKAPASPSADGSARAKRPRVPVGEHGGDGKTLNNGVPDAAKTKPAQTTPKDTSQNRYLKSLIKRVAEQHGFRATPEQSTPDGKGKVDVGLEREGRRIACEISITTGEEHELGNIVKCLDAGYDTIILCSPERKTLDKVKRLATERLSEDELRKVLFFQPEELFFYLDQEAAKEASREETVKGYRVKVEYQPLAEDEQKARREAVGQVILQAMRRLKEKERPQ